MRIVRAVLTFGGLTGVSRVFGLIREMLISRMLGASIVTDAFFVAFKFPNLFRRIFAEGAFSAAFVPQFSHLLVSDGPEAARQFASRTFSFLAAVLTIFVTLVVIFTPELIHVLAPGFITTPERLELTIAFTRITFPYILFISLAAHLSGVLTSFDRFAVAAAAPIVLNLVMIASLFVAPFFNIHQGTGLAIAVLIAGVLQFCWLFWACQRLPFSVRLAWPALTPEIKQLLWKMGPGVISAGVMNINLFVDMILASFLPERSISYLTFADRLNQLPLSMIGIAIGTALLPTLSRQLKAADFDRAAHSQRLAVEFSLHLSIPAAVGLMILAYPVINLIYGLPVDQTQAVASALTALAAGIPAYVLNKVFSSCFFARQDTKTPAKVAVISIIINFVLNLSLMWSLAHVGMAMATTIAAWVNVFILYGILHKRGWFDFSTSLRITSVKLILTAMVMAAALITLDGYLKEFPAQSVTKEILYVGASILVGIIVYGVCAFGFRSIKLDELKQALSR